MSDCAKGVGATGDCAMGVGGSVIATGCWQAAWQSRGDRGRATDALGRESRRCEAQWKKRRAVS